LCDAGVDGIGNVHAVELISRFGIHWVMLYSLISLICAPCFLLLTFIALSGTLENLLQSVDEIKEGKIKEVSEQVLQRLGKLVLLW